MSFWKQLIHKLGFANPARLSFDADVQLIDSLQLLAEREQRSKEALAADLLRRAIVQRQEMDMAMEHWRTLSPREQQVAALTCLGYTNRQIASYLGLSVDTVRSHTRNLLMKFGLSNKAQLRMALEEWDFSAWAVAGSRDEE